jgi:hypothetical protein
MAEQLSGEVKNITGELHFWSELNSDARARLGNKIGKLNPCAPMSLEK